MKLGYPYPIILDGPSSLFMQESADTLPTWSTTRGLRNSYMYRNITLRIKCESSISPPIIPLLRIPRKEISLQWRIHHIGIGELQQPHKMGHSDVDGYW